MGEEAQLMTELGDNGASGTRGRLQASHADRERVIEVLQDAFVRRAP